jgi:hypothetical protein
MVQFKQNDQLSKKKTWRTATVPYIEAHRRAPAVKQITAGLRLLPAHQTTDATHSVAWSHQSSDWLPDNCAAFCVNIGQSNSAKYL